MIRSLFTQCFFFLISCHITFRTRLTFFCQKKSILFQYQCCVTPSWNPSFGCGNRMYNKSFFFNFCGDKLPFCGVTSTFCFGLWLTLPMGSKARVDTPSPALDVACAQWILLIRYLFCVVNNVELHVIVVAFSIVGQTRWKNGWAIEFDWCDSQPLERRVLGYIPEACLLLVPGSIHLSGIICTSHSFKNKFN